MQEGKEIKVVALVRVLCFDTDPMETSFLWEVIFGIHCHLHVPSVIPILEIFTYALYFVISFVLVAI
jgi:hypothetical protein